MVLDVDGAHNRPTSGTRTRRGTTMTLRFHAEDEGKRVVTATGEVLGRIDRIRRGTAYVEPRPGLLAGFGSWIADPWPGRGPYPLDANEVDSVQNEAIVLKERDAGYERPRAPNDR